MRVTRATGDRAAIHRHILAEHVAIADYQARGLTLVFLVLRRIADGGELEHLVAGAQHRGAVDHGMRADPAARTDGHLGADDRERTDLDVVGNPRLGRDDCARVDACHGRQPQTGSIGVALSASGNSIISADAASASPT